MLRRKQVFALVIISLGLGVLCVIAGFRVSWLNWVVDLPGWIVSRFTSIDFHEGEGALGFFLATLLSWFWTSAACFFLTAWIWRRLQTYASARRS
jgi:hypothetical protein